jgi:hypothetical protein
VSVIALLRRGNWKWLAWDRQLLTSAGGPAFLEFAPAAGIYEVHSVNMSDVGRKDLVPALAALVKERRSCAKLLAMPYERGTYEATMARFVDLQTTIEAVERALAWEAEAS